MSGRVSPPITTVWKESGFRLYLLITAFRSGRAVPWMPIFLPGQSLGLLMLSFLRLNHANGCFWSAEAKALTGIPCERARIREGLEET